MCKYPQIECICRGDKRNKKKHEEKTTPSQCTPSSEGPHQANVGPIPLHVFIYKGGGCHCFIKVYRIINFTLCQTLNYDILYPPHTLTDLSTTWRTFMNVLKFISLDKPMTSPPLLVYKHVQQNKSYITLIKFLRGQNVSAKNSFSSCIFLVTHTHFFQLSSNVLKLFLYRKRGTHVINELIKYYPCVSEIIDDFN